MDAKIFCKLGIISEQCSAAKSKKFSGEPVHGSPHVGSCCCNCIHQRPINAHPANEGKTEGKLTTTIGFGCCLPELYPFIIFFDTPHGICESYEKK